MTIFYKKDISSRSKVLSEEESKHCVQVLRHKVGDQIMLFDGNGGVYSAKLTLIHKKACEFEIIDSKTVSKKDFSIHLAIAPTKNMDRMEWLIEKLSEIGVDQVTLIETQHSERKKLRIDRLHKKAISAMKQSGNPFLLQINELEAYNSFLSKSNGDVKLIAHVDDSYSYISKSIKPQCSVEILIGPEGDFSLSEVEMAVERGYKPVSLGKNTFRTETAGFVACCAVNLINEF